MNVGQIVWIWPLLLLIDDGCVSFFCFKVQHKFQILSVLPGSMPACLTFRDVSEQTNRISTGKTDFVLLSSTFVCFYCNWQQAKNANKQHVKDKNDLRRELHAERQKVKSLLDRKIPDAEKRKIAEDLLTPYMGETATKCFIKGKGGKFSKPRQWTKDEIILGVTLRTISKKVYNILRVRNIIPMPHPSTLRRYYADFQITEGKWHSVAF